MIELSIPHEYRMEQSHEFKTCKYDDLKTVREQEGYTVIVKAVKMGARGFAAGTLY